MFYLFKTLKLKFLLILTFLFTTFFSLASAQIGDVNTGTMNLKQAADSITNNVLTSVSTMLITGAFVLFFAGVVIFIYGRVTGKGSMSQLEKGKDFIIWGLVALFVMVSVWGIIKLTQSTLDINGNNINITPVQFSPLDTGSSESNTPSTTQGVLGNSQEPVDTSNVPVDNFPTVGPGYKGQYMAAIYALLQVKNCLIDNNTPYEAKDETAYYGPDYNDQYKEAIESFQRANNLSVDGVVGQQTWNILTDTKNNKACN